MDKAVSEFDWPGHSWFGLRLKLLFDSPAIYGRERRPPKTLAAARAAARAAAGGGAAGFPGAEAPGYRKN